VFDSTKTVYKLKGYIVANGVTDYHVDVWPSFAATVYNFNLIPKDLLTTITTNDCFFSFNDVIPYVIT